MNRRFIVGCMAALCAMALVTTGCGDEGSGCPEGLTKCGNQCVDTTNNPNHCGACDNACMTGQYCAASGCQACQNVCTSGQRRCAPGTSNQYQVCGADANGCMEWKDPQSCGAGDVCDNGQCEAGCSDDCGAGERECSGAGWRECGDYDADTCLEWSTVTDCAADEVCDERSATCIKSCSDECTPDGERRCIPEPTEEGYEICGDYDADSCLEWGGRVLCPVGQTCDSATSQCSSTCTDDCTEGQQICDGNGYRICGPYDADPCLDWSGITPCATWETCNTTTGACEVSCADECNNDGERRCVSDGYDVCGDYDSDPCKEWGGHVACPMGTRCDAGACIEDCEDECDTQGARICEDNGYRTCSADNDADSCLEWSAIVDCDAGEVCSNGACLETCEDECAQDERECIGNAWHDCIVQADPLCNIWSALTPCGAGEICDLGTATCIPACSDECTTLGDKECYANGWRECGEYDADVCLDWSQVNPCPAGQICDPGTVTCEWDCTDDCTPQGGQVCAGDGYDVCGDYDVDPCLEWGGHVVCPAGTSCSGGACLEVCADECTSAGEQTCDGNGFRICGEYDTDTCLDWSGITYCAYNEQCQDGACVEWCQEECSVGARECVSGQNAFHVCGQFDPDPCLEWSTSTTCAGAEMCYRGVCIHDTPPADVLVNEILYDDDGNDGEYVYIELWGTGGLSLDNFSVVGINGANGSTFMTIDLDGYALPADDHFVISTTLAIQELADVTDLVTDDADLQNGPDNVQVVWGGSVIVDALGYETFGAGDVFAGEGTEAASADYDSTNDIMYCLSRRADDTRKDTDDNSVDFMRRTMCTPGWEGPGALLWESDWSWGGTATPAVDSLGNIYVADAWGYLWGVDSTGATVFNPFPDDYLTSSITIAWDESALYAGTENGLVALDPATGSTLAGWPATNPSAGCEVYSTPAADPVDAPNGLDGWIFYGNRCGTPSFEAVNASGGSEWSYPTADVVDSSPVRILWTTGESWVCFGVGGSGAGELVCLDAADGSLAWAQGTGGGCYGSPAVGSDGTVYVGCDDGFLWAFDGYDGSPRANFPVGIVSIDSTTTLVEGCSPVVAPADIGGDYIFATSRGDDGNAWVYHSDGTQVLGGTLPNNLSSMTIALDSTFLAHTGPFLGAYTLGGNLEWDAVIGDTATDWIASSPVIAPVINAGDPVVVYVLEYNGPSRTGTLYAIQGSAPLFDSAGSYPKFRGNWYNMGWGM